MELLDLNDANIRDDMMPGLAGMKKLRRLAMIGTLAGDEGVKYLRDLTELEDLDLYGVKITDIGVQYLRKLTKLRRLNLLGAQITDASAEILAGFKEWRHVVRGARLFGNPIALRDAVAIEPEHETLADRDRPLRRLRFGGIRGARRVEHGNQRRQADGDWRVRRGQALQEQPARESKALGDDVHFLFPALRAAPRAAPIPTIPEVP